MSDFIRVRLRQLKVAFKFRNVNLIQTIKVLAVVYSVFSVTRTVTRDNHL